ncbi:MAG: DUF2254 domain-containing protein [Flavisolibacter sp.]|nr:DUF2254 domain-containing protein [Flavisolibacter sp.]
MKNIIKWVREHYNTITNSIAFYPAVIATLFLVFSWLMLHLDFSDWGKQLKTQWSWISLKDANTARTMVSVIGAGIISLTVFSFSMVMIVLNQAASKMSNRILDTMIGNRFQQIILGFYIGTIVYALFLLSTIRDINSGIYVPALSIYLLVLLTVADVFLFIYFLHYVTQTVKYETIIQRIYEQTLHALKKEEHSDGREFQLQRKPVAMLLAPVSGYFQDFDKKQLLAFAQSQDVVIEFLKTKGTYFIKDTEFLNVYGKEKLSVEQMKTLFLGIDFFNGQPISKNPFYGFNQLTEVAIKALSPGINDPATAVLSLHALSDLLAYYLHQPVSSVVCDQEKNVRIVTREPSFSDLFHQCLLPVWHYGKEDPYIQRSMLATVQQLQFLDKEGRQLGLLNQFANEVKEQMQKNHLPDA